MKIYRDANKLFVVLNYKLPVGGYTRTLEQQFESEFQAKIQCDNLMGAFGDLVESIRREEYERGWKDAKSHKKPKKNRFSCCLEKGQA